LWGTVVDANKLMKIGRVVSIYRMLTNNRDKMWDVRWRRLDSLPFGETEMLRSGQRTDEGSVKGKRCGRTSNDGRALALKRYGISTRRKPNGRRGLPKSGRDAPRALGPDSPPRPRPCRSQLCRAVSAISLTPSLRRHAPPIGIQLSVTLGRSHPHGAPRLPRTV
jgi:hypothetical protein